MTQSQPHWLAEALRLAATTIAISVLLAIVLLAAWSVAAHYRRRWRNQAWDLYVNEALGTDHHHHVCAWALTARSAKGATLTCSDCGATKLVAGDDQ